MSWTTNGLRFHDLRHEAASRNVEADCPMHAVSLWLGHTNLTTTARYLNADVAQLHALNDRPGPSCMGRTAISIRRPPEGASVPPDLSENVRSSDGTVRGGTDVATALE